MAFWSISCERQTRRIRETFFRSILNKEIAYFDTNKTGQLSTRLTDDVNKVHDGIGDKVGSALQFVASALAGMILGYVRLTGHDRSFLTSIVAQIDQRMEIDPSDSVRQSTALY